MLIPIADRHLDYAHDVAKKLEAEGLRVEVDERAERMNAKIRDAQNQKIPYMLVVGDREVETGTLSPRRRSGEAMGAVKVEDFVAQVKSEYPSLVRGW
jgi:threonyl-tRNA synthetase